MRKRPIDAQYDTSANQPVGTSIVISTVTCLAAAIAYQHGSLQENEIEISNLADQLDAAQGTEHEDPNQPPAAPHPMHPPRLGGVYYRGNDERSERLFNNGYYRTAEIRIDLVDKNANVLKVSDSIPPGEVSIQLSIKRSAGAEHRMFDKRSLETSFLSSSYLGTEKATDRISLKKTSDDEWVVIYPLEIPADGSNAEAQELNGDLYLYYGPLNQNKIHYSAHYKLAILDGKIQPGSEIWMASTYNLNGRVLLPNQKDILLDRWFDFRPIPVVSDETKTQ